jgi:hypothetical protein
MEYEYLLQEKLRNLNIQFLNEDQMREKGYPKTPDIKLEVNIFDILAFIYILKKMQLLNI